MSTGAGSEPAVVTVRLCELPQLHAFDAITLKDILTTLGERAAGWQWWMDSNSEVNSTGAEHADPSVEAICRMVLDLGNRGQRQGIWLSGQDLERFARTLRTYYPADHRWHLPGRSPRS